MRFAHPHSRAILAALFLLTACDGGGTTPTPQPVVSGFAVVSGNGQRAQVRPPSGAQLAVASNDPTLLPELLVGRVLITTGSSSVAAPARSHGRPSFQTVPVPSGTVVNWEVGIAGVAGADARCGSPRVPATQADDSAYVANGWRRGTLAGTPCVTRTALYVGTTLVEADSFTATFDPGPPSATYDTGISSIGPFPRTVGANAVQDAHGNAVAFGVEGDANFSVAGTEVGTAEARTVTFLGTVDPSVNQRFILRLLGAGGTHVGNLLVVVQGDGLNFWQAAGASVPLS